MSIWLPRRPQLYRSVLHASLTTSYSSRTLHHPAPRIIASNPQVIRRQNADLPSSRQASTAASTSDNKSDESKSSPPAVSKEKEPLSMRVWKKVKYEAQHYWHGSKLLVSEVRISARLQMKLLRGGSLTRRERRQLKRTTTDLLRLIPFAVFVIVPFMELLLPVALKLFPNMLPSTFEDKFAAEEKQRKLLRMRLEMAKFLQETLRESGLKSNARILRTDEFKEFFRKVRSTGGHPSAEDITKVAKLFDDDLTLDNLSRPQLVSISRYMGVNAFGTDNFLRGTIRGRIAQIRRDDALIDAEGVDSLTVSELQHACQSRGIRTTGVSPSRLREEMTTWIKLHAQERVSGVLLMLSRAFNYDRKSTEDGATAVLKSLESVLSGLPDTLLSEAELEIDADKASYKEKLEVLQQQEELIEDEEEQEQEEKEARRAKKEADEAAKREEEARMAHLLLPESELQSEAEVEDEDARMTTEQLKELGEALSILSAKSSVLKERDELRALMEENSQTAEEESVKPNPLVKRIRSMITKVESQLSDYDQRVGSSLQMISLDSQGRISIRDLEHALTLIKHAPEEDVAQAVVRKLDVDKDGFVQLDHVLDLIREEGLGVVIDDDAQSLLGQGRALKEDLRPRKEDIVSEG